MTYYEVNTSRRNDESEVRYIDKPPETVDLENDGREEILAVRNISSMPIQFSRIRFFKEGVIVLTSFDGYDFTDRNIFSVQGCINDYYIHPGKNGGGDKLYLAQLIGKYVIRPPSSRLVVVNNIW